MERHHEAIEFPGGLILADRARGRLHILNPVAGIIWRAPQAGVSAEDMAMLLAEGFGIELRRARTDLDNILAQWQGQGLLDEPPGAGRPRQGGRVGRPLGRAAGLGRTLIGESAQTFDLCGTPFALRLQPEELAEGLKPLLAHAEAPAARPVSMIEAVRNGRAYSVIRDGRVYGRERTLQAAAGLVVRAICDVSYPEADWLMFLHAAAVARGDGAIVLAGPNGSGKSTLTAALLDQGFAYLSDDVVPVDACTLRIMPVPLAMSVKQGSWATLGALYPELLTSPAHLGRIGALRYLAPAVSSCFAGRDGASARWLVFPEFGEDVSFGAQPLELADVLKRLVAAGCLLPLDAAGIRRLMDWLENVSSWVLRYGSLKEAIDWIVDLRQK